jgi:hypothetical protein
MSGESGWIVGGMLAISFALAVEAGFQFRGHAVAGKAAPERLAAGADLVMLGVLGLLGLVLSFVLCVVAGRYEARAGAAVIQAAARDHVSEGMLWALIAASTAAAVIVGYGLAVGGRRKPVTSTALFVMVALGIMLVIDLDEAQRGEPLSGRVGVATSTIQPITSAGT